MNYMVNHVFVTLSELKMFLRIDCSHDYRLYPDVKSGITKHRLLLAFIGLTYTVNMIATYTAKLTAPSAGYVGAIKSASVLPMVIIGFLFFKEKIAGIQLAGLVLILLGLALLAMN